MSKFENKIVNEDSLEILKKIPDKTFNLIFADPHRTICKLEKS